MGDFLGRILDNDSVFGQIMTRCGILIGANLMFAVFCLPVVTAGPAAAALYYVMLKVLAGDRELNPFVTFWQGFRMNWKQALIFELGAAALVLLGWMDIRFCLWAGGIFTYFRYAIYVLGVLLFILTLYFFPVLAAYEDTLPHLCRNAFFFAARRPHKIFLAAAVIVLPALVTYLDPVRRPLYGFCYVTFGCAGCAMAVSSLLIRDFLRFDARSEPDAEADGEMPADETDAAASRAADEKRSLKEMKKLGM